MRDLHKWKRWRQELESSPVFSSCWNAIKRSELYRKLTRGTWSIMSMEQLSKEDLLREHYAGADTNAPQYHELLKDLGDTSDVCVFTTETTDTTGLSKTDVPSLLGKTYTVIVDAQHATILHVEEGVQVA